jgi:hypothetical protein
MGKRLNNFGPEMRERAVWMLFEQEYPPLGSDRLDFRQRSVARFTCGQSG